MNIYGKALTDRNGNQIRSKYYGQYETITDTLELRATIRAGHSTNIGEYTCYLKTASNHAICMDCGEVEYRPLSVALKTKGNPDILVTGSAINWDNANLNCYCCKSRIVPHSERS